MSTVGPPGSPAPRARPPPRRRCTLTSTPQSSAAPAIRIEGVDVEFEEAGRRVQALRGLDLEVQRGETLCLIGPSGCGKTSTLRLVNRMLEPTRGRVLVEGRDVAEADPIPLRRGIGYVIQRGGLFPHMSVRRNVGLLCALEDWDAARIRARVDELLALVRMDPADYGERYPGQLSGGQAQRVGVARALALDPAVVLMDEPFGALDPSTRRELQDELLELKRSVDKTVVFVTHDLEEAFRLGDRVGVMSAGRLVSIGTREELRAAPGSDEVARYLGGEGDES